MTVVDEIKSRLDILDVVSQYTQLQRSGRSYKALCPFHTEKTPSFFVFPERQSWRCFGACATGGDIFGFLMRVENLDFGEALKRLAQKGGVNLAEKGSRKAETDVLYRINECTRDFFCRMLSSAGGGARARAYLQKRGLTDETIEKFQIGLSTGDGESIKGYLTSQGYTEEQMALAGVVTQRQEGGYRDLFRRRLMFPIRDTQGRLAGFGGRVQDDSQPKYLNSPRSPIFDKGQILYALHLARDGIGERGLVIVEGYMDAIVAHQAGFSNVVASMGTALTRQQVSLVRATLRRAGSQDPGEVVLALDPDVAGQEATLRSLESSWNVFQTRHMGSPQGSAIYERSEMPALKVAALPQGMDPDEIIRENPDHWSGLIDGAVPLMDYLFGTLSSRLDMSTPQGKARLAELLFPLIAATPDALEQDHYFQRLASLLGVSEATLQASLGRPSGKRASQRATSNRSQQIRGTQPGPSGGQGHEAATTPFARLDHDPLEEHSLVLLLRYPYLREPADSGPSELEGREEEPPLHSLRPEYFQRVENREVFTNWIKCSTLDDLRESLDEELREHVEHLMGRNMPPSDRKLWEADFRYSVRRLEVRYLRQLNREEELRLSQATAEERQEQEIKLLEVSQRLRDIFRE